jgi:hypothetical protein
MAGQSEPDAIPVAKQEIRKMGDFSLKVFFRTGGSEWIRGFYSAEKTRADAFRIAAAWIAKRPNIQRFQIRVPASWR